MLKWFVLVWDISPLCCFCTSLERTPVRAGPIKLKHRRLRVMTACLEIRWIAIALVPMLIQALAWAVNGKWHLMDSSQYPMRMKLYLAPSWCKSGIMVLHTLLPVTLNYFSWCVSGGFRVEVKGIWLPAALNDWSMGFMQHDMTIAGTMH